MLRIKWKLSQLEIWLDVYHPKVRAFFRWFERIYWAQHNARVIMDFETRMMILMDAATRGRLSKPYYTAEVIQSEIEEAFMRKYEEGYDDAKSEYEPSAGPPRPSSPPEQRIVG